MEQKKYYYSCINEDEELELAISDTSTNLQAYDSDRLPTPGFSQLKGHFTGVSLSILACFIVVVFIQSLYILRLNQTSTLQLLTPNGLSRERTVDRTIYLPNPYWSNNQSESDLAWDFISAGFGIVAVEEEYADKQGLPKSEVWREDSRKRVYVLEAYHAIHCLWFLDLPSADGARMQRRLRAHYLSLFHGNRWDWPVEHDMHCLDGLREYVMCNPDDTLLWTTGHGDVGHGQSKKCQDWDALRDWAAERTISYFDYERGFEKETKGIYHTGDGLPIGSF